MTAWIHRNLLYRPATWLRGEPVFRLLRQYEESQWWDAATLARHQERLLEQTLRFAAAHTGYYARAARRAGLDPERLSRASLEHLPVLSKLELVEHLDDLQSWRLPGTTSWKTTGGSTGMPVRLRKSRFATAAEQAASWRSYGWFGIQPGDRQARFWGTPLRGHARRRARAIDAVLNRDRFSAFAFRRDDLRRYFERLAASHPVWAYGYVSMLVEFASFCLAEGLPLAELRIRSVVTTSEVLGDDERALIGQAFGAPVFDEYGCGEVGPILYECEKGRLHLMAENLFVELVPEPTPAEPRAARLLVTDLHNRATPLIRYDVGDRVVPAEGCDCGRGLPSFLRVFGRAYDFITARDGARFHGEFFLYLLEEARDRGASLLQGQFVQRGSDRIEIRLVPGVGYDPTEGKALAVRLEEKSEGRLHGDVVLVEALPREPSGKIRLIQAQPPSEKSSPGNGQTC